VGWELLVALSAVVCAPISVWLAARRDRNRALWAFYGVLLGPIALMILAAAPPAFCPSCGSRWSGWAPACAVCRGGRVASPIANRHVPVGGSPTVAVGLDTTVDLRRAADGVEAQSEALAATEPIGGLDGDGDKTAATVEATVMATGIFLRGSPALIIGMPYGIGVSGDNIVVTGPLTTAPGEIVIEQPRKTADISITARGSGEIPEQALLTAGQRHRGRPDVGLLFGSLSVAHGMDLEQLARPSADKNGPASRDRTGDV
jgi:hypothetical protein